MLTWVQHTTSTGYTSRAGLLSCCGQTDTEREDESRLPRPRLVEDAVTRPPSGRPLSARGQLSGGIIAVSDEIRLHAA